MLMLAPPRNMILRDYQLDAIEALRQGIRAGFRRQILCAPTGAGKTVIAAELLRQADLKGKYAVFLVDRVALVDQTSQMLEDYGIRHGVLQGINDRYAPRENVQVASIQTLSRRQLPRRPDLIFYDEAHAQYGSALAFLAANPAAQAIGLTATPFTPGMGQYWKRLVNVTTARALIDAGHLVEPVMYVARSPAESELIVDGRGEFSDESATASGLRIVGDVVAEWMAKTTEHFGGPAKTIVFSPTVEHGRELCAAFASAGFNFQQISYKDRSDATRAEKIVEFRRPDSLIHGLISCGVLTKGFDVPDVLVGISCKPYRKSLSSHMQEIGRVMRPITGEKKKALWLDHAGNLERFASDMFDVWENGAGDLDGATTRDRTPRIRDQQTREKVVCPECSGALRGNTCLACGWERPARSGIVAVQGSLRAFAPTPLQMRARNGLRAACLADPKTVWEGCLAYALDHSREDGPEARKWAYAIWAWIYPDQKLPSGWFSLLRPEVLPDAYALAEREVKRFRKQRRTA
jgi:DNA repair protein RadD